MSDIPINLIIRFWEYMLPVDHLVLSELNNLYNELAMWDDLENVQIENIREQTLIKYITYIIVHNGNQFYKYHRYNELSALGYMDLNTYNIYTFLKHIQKDSRETVAKEIELKISEYNKSNNLTLDVWFSMWKMVHTSNVLREMLGIIESSDIIQLLLDSDSDTDIDLAKQLIHGQMT